jgi:hypothetical protein
MLEFSEEEYGQVCCSPAHESSLKYDTDGTPIVVQEQPQTGPIALTDALGNTWCQECLHRGEFINWGKAHGWPAMEIHPYALLQGAYFWQVTAIQGDEDRVWSFLSLIEMLDERRESVA